MKTQLVLSLLAVLCASALAFPENIINTELDAHWETYKTVFSKEYAKQVENVRRLIWEENLRYIQKHNLEADLGKHTYHLGINHFGDWTHQEFKAVMLKWKPTIGMTKDQSQRQQYRPPLNVNVIPTKVDWRGKGYVTPVKNQGQCGSCWSFSATGALEGQWFRKTGHLISLSEQQLMDCSRNYGNNGCHGGLMDFAFEYIEKYGVETEKSYPYEAKDETCRYNESSVVAKCNGYVDIQFANESDLQSAVAFQGPVSVAIDASHISFQFYSSGIYNEPQCSQFNLDHGVLTVGYGDGYWLVKNSWGIHWGDQGYIKMSRNKGNQCGIATSASYPTV